MSPDNEGYEFEERAAIRQYDAGTEKPDAEQLALDDIKHRGNDKKTLIKRLQRRASELTKLIEKERNMQRSDELMKEWMRLRLRIIELRKEPKDDNDGRVPG